MVRSRIAFVAIALASSAVLAEDLYKNYSELGRIDQMRYDSCVTEAAAMPTPQGVSIANSTCRRRFMLMEAPKAAASRLTAQQLRTHAEQIAADFNTRTTFDAPVVRARAQAEGSTVTFTYAVPRAPVNKIEVSNSVRDSAHSEGCEQFQDDPAFRSGLRVSYVYDFVDGERIASTDLTAVSCGQWRRSHPR